MLFATIDEIIDCTPEEKPMTNADRIRAMSDEELAKWIDFCPHVRCPMESCETCLLAWLKQPAEEEA